MPVLFRNSIWLTANSFLWVCMLAGDEEAAVMLLSGQSVKTALYAISVSAKVPFPVSTSNIIHLFEFQWFPKFVPAWKHIIICKCKPWLQCAYNLFFGRTAQWPRRVFFFFFFIKCALSSFVYISLLIFAVHLHFTDNIHTYFTLMFFTISKTVK